MADLSELQGEVLALTCAVAALMNTAPIASQASVWRRFDELADLLLANLGEAGKAGFSCATVRIRVRRQTTADRADIPSQCLDEAARR